MKHYFSYLFRALLALLLLCGTTLGGDWLKITWTMDLEQWVGKHHYDDSLTYALPYPTPCVMCFFIELDAEDQDPAPDHGVFLSSNQSGMLQVYMLDGDNEVVVEEIHDQVRVETFSGRSDFYGYLVCNANEEYSTSANVPVGGAVHPALYGWWAFSLQPFSSSTAPTDALSHIYSQQDNQFNTYNNHAYMSGTSLDDESAISSEADNVINYSVEILTQ